MTEGAAFTTGRLGSSRNAVNVKYAVEPKLRTEMSLLDAYMQVDMAHTVMLSEQGVLADDQTRGILRGLREIAGLDDGEFPVDPERGSVLLQVEHFLAERIGHDMAGRMHTGRSRNDHQEAANRVLVRDRLLDVADATLRLQDTVLDLALEHADALMPGYTHLQHAQPTTLGHYIMRHYYPFERDQQRLQGAFKRTNLSALGGAACVGTTWPVDRHRTAELLGHGGLVVHATDAGVFARDYPAENAAVLSILANDVGRLAGDLYVWSTWEFGMIEVEDGMANTSSIMPQKKNPEALERVRGLSGISVGWLPAVLGALRSATSSDLELAFGPDPTQEMIDSTIAVLELTRESLETTMFNTDVMRDRAEVNWTTATNLADELVRSSGLSFRAAHQIVGRLVRNAVSEGVAPDDVTSEMVVSAADEVGIVTAISQENVDNSLDPTAFLQSLTTVGSANPAEVRRMIAEGHGLQATHRGWLDETVACLATARQELTAAVDGRLSGVGE